MTRVSLAPVFLLLILPARHLMAQGHEHHEDSSFAAMQKRGATAMGVDQYTSVHHFDNLPDGGRIALQRDTTDTEGVRTIRTHLQSIARAFSNGDFQIPGFVHDGDVPGTATMSARRSAIQYQFHALPGGGEVRITAKDSTAVSAIHEFLEFQRTEHHAEGKR